MGKISTKYLIQEDGIVIMKGEYVIAGELTRDFVYETSGNPLKMKTMQSIAGKNGFTVSGKKVADVQKSFNNGLNGLKLSEKNEMSTTEKVAEIVKKGMDEKSSEDQILINIVTSGVKFQRAAKLMQTAMVALGFSVSSKDRYNRCKLLMEDDGFEPEEWSEVETMANSIVDSIQGTTYTQAVAQIRKYCREFEISFPKRVKERQNPLFIQALAWIVENLKEEKTEDVSEAFEEWMCEKGFREKAIERWKKNFIKIGAQMAANEKAD